MPGAQLVPDHPPDATAAELQSADNTFMVTFTVPHATEGQMPVPHPVDQHLLEDWADRFTEETYRPGMVIPHDVVIAAIQEELNNSYTAQRDRDHVEGPTFLASWSLTPKG